MSLAQPCESHKGPGWGAPARRRSCACARRSGPRRQGRGSAVTDVWAVEELRRAWRRSASVRIGPSSAHSASEAVACLRVSRRTSGQSRASSGQFRGWPGWRRLGRAGRSFEFGAGRDARAWPPPAPAPPSPCARSDCSLVRAARAPAERPRAGGGRWGPESGPASRVTPRRRRCPSGAGSLRPTPSLGTARRGAERCLYGSRV